MIDVHAFDSENNLVEWIKAYTGELFGEDIQWKKSDIRCDLFGQDSNNTHVIVEVKNWYEDRPNRGIQEYTSVGQIIKYASDYEKKYTATSPPRLFIIGSDRSSIVESCCELLRKHNVNIQHLSVIEDVWVKRNQALEKEIEALEKEIEALNNLKK